MRISVKTSGGFGNIRLQGQLDTDELEVSFAKKVQAVLTLETLKSISGEKSGQVPDAMQYEIDLFMEDEFRSFVVDDSNAPPDVLDVIQEILQQIVKKKTKGI